MVAHAFAKGIKGPLCRCVWLASITFYAIIATYFLRVLRCPEASAAVESIAGIKLRNGTLSPLDKAESL